MDKFKLYFSFFIYSFEISKHPIENEGEKKNEKLKTKIWIQHSTMQLQKCIILNWKKKKNFNKWNKNSCMNDNKYTNFKQICELPI